MKQQRFPAVRMFFSFFQLDPKEQLKNVAQLKVYKYNYNDDFVDTAGMSEDEKYDTGVLAQELKEVLPDAVRETGDLTLSSGERLENFLIVNKVGGQLAVNRFLVQFHINLCNPISLYTLRPQQSWQYYEKFQNHFLAKWYLFILIGIGLEYIP